MRGVGLLPSSVLITVLAASSSVLVVSLHTGDIAPAVLLPREEQDIVEGEEAAVAAVLGSGEEGSAALTRTSLTKSHRT